jgi:hypothetical protein
MHRQAAEKLGIYTRYTVGTLHAEVDVNKAAGCSKILSGKIATSEEARRMLRYVELLSDTRLMWRGIFQQPANGFLRCGESG